MSLTEAGKRYHERISQVLDDLSNAELSIGPLRQMPSGVLRVSAPITFTLTRLPAILADFLRDYPAVSLDLHLDDRRVDIVKEGFDVAIRGSDRLDDSSLVARRLMNLKHVVCATPAYLERFGTPLLPDDLLRHELIQFTLSSHAGEWIFEKGGLVSRVPVNGRLKVTNSLAVREALRQDFGMSLIPEVYVRDDLRTGKLVAVLGDWSPTLASMYAVYPSREYLLPKVRAFVDYLSLRLGEEEGAGAGTAT